MLVHEVEIDPVDDFEGEIGKTFELLRRTSLLVTKARNQRSFPIVLSGNCVATAGVAAGISASSELKDVDLTCVWFDAHDDFNTPDTVVSGYFDSMAIAMMVGDCWKEMMASVPGQRTMDLQRFVHVGMRDVSELERKRVNDSHLCTVWGGVGRAGHFGRELSVELEKRGAGHPAVVHVDLDCLDVSLGKVNKFSAPGGLIETDLDGCLHVIARKVRPVSLTLASFDPSFEGAENIARIAVSSVKNFVVDMANHGQLVRNSSS